MLIKKLDPRTLLVALCTGSLLSLAVYLKLDHFAVIPGDVGDARFNNYILENFYHFFVHGNSLWNPTFFYPYPYVIGFSDNLFGTGLIYSLFRSLHFQTDTAFQLWFLSGYLCNFFSAYYCLQKLGIGRAAAFLGALVFTLAPPTSAHSPHAQLHYRFACALAITYLLLFIQSNRLIFLNWSFCWLVVQFYCGVYIGVFSALFIAILFFFAPLLSDQFKPIESFRNLPNIQHKLMALGFGLASATALVLLFFPYLEVSHLYGFERGWAEIASMLPRLQSHWLSDESPLWGPVSRSLPEVPVRYEHQMFIGLASTLLLLNGIALSFFIKTNVFFKLLIAGWITCFLLTVSIDGYSLWYLIYRAPLLSAIRGITRIDQVLLFPIAYICAWGADHLFSIAKTKKIVAFCVLAILVIAEWALTPYPWVSQKAEWRSRIAAIEATLPAHIDRQSILFIAQTQGPFYADEIDAMWVAMNHQLPTLNGYSGNIPNGYQADFGRNCSELDKRLEAYHRFQVQKNLPAQVRDLRSHILVLGFTNCPHE